MQHSGATKKANGVGAVTSSAKMTSTRYSYTALKLTACNIAGIIFGIAAEKGKGEAPAVSSFPPVGATGAESPLCILPLQSTFQL